MEQPSIRTQIERLGPWFHNLHLPGGVQTCPEHSLGDYPRLMWNLLAPALPDRLGGWSALDIGCNAGFYSFELARRGARVTALDANRMYLDQARWAAELMEVPDAITWRQGQIYELGRGDEQWDLVLFLGVFYHLRYPLLGLDIASRATRRLLVFQSLSMPGLEVEEDTRNPGLHQRERLTGSGWPKMAFLEHRLADDRTNWWAPNHACVEAMLRSTGMRVVARPASETYVCVPERDNGSSMWTWDAEEFEAAVGRPRPRGR